MGLSQVTIMAEGKMEMVQLVGFAGDLIDIFNS